MKNLAVLAAAGALALGTLHACAQDTTNVVPIISSLQASNYIGKQVVVTGIVAQVSLRPSLTFLNFEKPYPKSPFAAVVRSRNTNQFDDLSALRGKAVSVNGQMRDYNGRPEIELTRKSQLKLLSEPK